MAAWRAPFMILICVFYRLFCYLTYFCLICANRIYFHTLQSIMSVSLKHEKTAYFLQLCIIQINKLVRAKSQARRAIPLSYLIYKTHEEIDRRCLACFSSAQHSIKTGKRRKQLAWLKAKATKKRQQEVAVHGRESNLDHAQQLHFCFCTKDKT